MGKKGWNSTFNIYIKEMNEIKEEMIKEGVDHIKKPLKGKWLEKALNVWYDTNIFFREELEDNLRDYIPQASFFYKATIEVVVEFYIRAKKEMDKLKKIKRKPCPLPQQ